MILNSYGSNLLAQLSRKGHLFYFEQKKTGQPSSKGQLSVRNCWIQDPSQCSKEYKSIKAAWSAYQELIFHIYIFFIYKPYAVYKTLLMHKIYNWAGLILCQYSTVQLGPIKIPVLVRSKYLKRWTSYTCILIFYFSTESKQMFFLELRLKFNKYFKMVLHLKQQSCTPPLLHSFILIPTNPFLNTSTFVCWSVHCAAVQLDSAEK